jgi:hypothetical protein
MNERPPANAPEHVADDEHQKDERCPTCKGAGWLLKKDWATGSLYQQFGEKFGYANLHQATNYKITCWHCGGARTYAAALADKITGEAERRANNPTRL